MVEDAFEQRILSVLDARSPDASICPSEVARATCPSAWRALMPEVRASALALARAGAIEITRRGRVLDPRGEIRGAIRLRRRRAP
jgi:hypothetical protein